MSYYSIKHSHGVTETHATYEDALAAVRSVYTDPSVGHSGDISDGGDSTLVWASEADAAHDDGSRAVCKISKRHAL